MTISFHFFTIIFLRSCTLQLLSPWILGWACSRALFFIPIVFIFTDTIYIKSFFSVLSILSFNCRFHPFFCLCLQNQTSVETIFDERKEKSVQNFALKLNEATSHNAAQISLQTYKKKKKKLKEKGSRNFTPIADSIYASEQYVLSSHTVHV